MLPLADQLPEESPRPAPRPRPTVNGCRTSNSSGTLTSSTWANRRSVPPRAGPRRRFRQLRRRDRGPARKSAVRTPRARNARRQGGRLVLRPHLLRTHSDQRSPASRAGLASRDALGAGNRNRRRVVYGQRGLCVSSAPLLTYVTSFEATPTPRTFEFEAWLPSGTCSRFAPATRR